MSKFDLKKYLIEGRIHLDEGSYSDFEESYNQEISQAIKKLNTLANVDVYDEMDDIERALQHYDTNVLSQITNWIDNGVSRRDIITFAVENLNKYGTEMKMILYAIDDYWDTANISDEMDDMINMEEF